MRLYIPIYETKQIDSKINSNKNKTSKNKGKLDS